MTWDGLLNIPIVLWSCSSVGEERSGRLTDGLVLMRSITGPVSVVKSTKAKLSIYWSAPILVFDHKLWVMTD